MPLFTVNADLANLTAAVTRVADAIEQFNYRTYGVEPGEKLHPLDAGDGDSSVEYMTDEESLVASGLTFAEKLEAAGYPAGEVRKLLDGYFADEKR